MALKRKLFLFCLSTVSFFIAHAQIEVAHLSSKGFSATGFGGFLSFTIPVSEANAVTAEIGVLYFKQGDNSAAVAPILAGFRHSFDGTGTGLYIEPLAGYSIGATDIQKYNENGQAILNEDGSWAEVKMQGVTGGMSVGYLLPGNLPFNFGLRYQHVFVSGDPSPNIFSFRVSYSFSRFGRRSDD